MAFDSAPSASGGFSTRDIPLRLHSWFLAHRFQLKKWWVVLILAIDIALLGVIIVGLLSFFLQSGKYERLALNMAKGLEPASLLREQRILPLEDGAVTVLSHDEVSDYLASITNPNEDWLSHIEYHFDIAGVETSARSATILPGQTRYLMSLNESIGKGSGQASLIVDSSTWSRLIDRTRLEGSSFTVENLSFEPAAVAPNTGQTYARVSADVVNSSLYGYWDVEVPIVVLSLGRPVAAQVVTLRAFQSGERRTLSAQWFERMPSDATVTIQPTVDISDEENYMNG